MRSTRRWSASTSRSCGPAGREAGHLLPVPRTREALDVLAANVARLSAELTVPVALEVIAALFDWPDDELAEPEFLAAVGDRTGALLLLDVANVYANAVNRAQDPRAVLDRILDLVPADRIGYVHVAGGSARHDEAGWLYHDTHTDPVPDAVLGLLATSSSARRGCRCCWSATAATHPPPCSPPSSPPIAQAPAHDPRTPDGESSVSQGGESGRFRHAVSAISGTLAERQAALVAALVAGAPDPPGFDPARLAAARRALLRKRAGEAAKHWPVLAASLGPRWSTSSPRSTQAVSRAERCATAGTSPAPCAPSSPPTPPASCAIGRPAGATTVPDHPAPVASAPPCARSPLGGERGRRDTVTAAPPPGRRSGGGAAVATR